MGEYARWIRKAVPKCWPRGPLCDCMGPTPAIDCATLLMILCAKRWNSAKILFAWYLLGWGTLDGKELEITTWQRGRGKDKHHAGRLR